MTKSTISSTSPTTENYTLLYLLEFRDLFQSPKARDNRIEEVEQKECDVVVKVEFSVMVVFC